MGRARVRPEHLCDDGYREVWWEVRTGLFSENKSLGLILMLQYFICSTKLLGLALGWTLSSRLEPLQVTEGWSNLIVWEESVTYNEMNSEVQ